MTKGKLSIRKRKKGGKKEKRKEKENEALGLIKDIEIVFFVLSFFFLR